MKARLVLVLVTAAGVAAGCGGGSSGGSAQPAPQSSATSTTPSPTATVTAPTPTVTKTTTHSGSGCATHNLGITLGQGQGAAGTFYAPIVFTNNGSSTCTLFGYPGVSYTDSHHTQIGPSAAHSPGSKERISLPPGQQASALLRQPDTGNYADSACHKEGARFLKVYPPGEKVAAYFALPSGTFVCTTSAGRASVGTVQAGTDPR